MINIKGKTVEGFNISDRYVTLCFDDGSSVEFTARGGCCCCCDAELECLEYDPPQLGPEPPPPPPAPFRFLSSGEFAVTIRDVARVPDGFRAVFTLDADPSYARHWAPVSADAEDLAQLVVALPIQARLTVTRKTTWEKLAAINAGREFDKQHFTFTFDLHPKET